MCFPFRNARQRMPSSLGSNNQSGLENGSRVSVASIGFSHTGCVRRRSFLRTSSGRMLNNEFGIASILEEELQVFCVESKLMDRSANLIGKGGIGRSPGPAIASARVLELQLAAVQEMQSGLIKRRIHNIARDLFL